MGSYKFSLNMAEVIGLIKKSALVALAAGLAYVGQNLSQIDLGAASAFIVPVVVLVIDTVVKWAKDNSKE